MEDGNVFFYAALVLIAFISWVVGRIRDAVEAVRERQRNNSRQRRGDLGPVSNARAVVQPPPPPQAQAQRPQQSESTSDALRETYRALGIPFPEDQAPPAPPAQTSVRPSTAKPQIAADLPKTALNQLTKAEQRAFEQLQKREAAAALARAKQRTLPKVEYRNDRSSATIRELLKDRNATRQAILLKEILGPPRSIEPLNPL